MIQKVEYTETNIDNHQIANDTFYHLLLKTANPDLISKAEDFYEKNPVTPGVRYSGYKNKIINIK